MPTLPSPRCLTLLLIGGLSGPLHAGSPAAHELPSPPAHELLAFDTELKGRLEVRDNNYDFDSSVNGPQDASWLLTRFRLGALFTPAAWFKAYVQGQDIREIGGSRPNNIGSFGADGDDAFDLLQGWINLGDETGGLSLKAGRQPFNYGDQRLLGNPQWSNPTRAWDGARLRYAAADWQADLFLGSPVSFINNRWNQAEYFNRHESRNAFVGGLYAGSKTLVPWQSTTDVYLLNYQADKLPGAAGAPLGASGRTHTWALGTLWKGDPAKLRQWDYEVEMALQFGRAAGLDQRAFAGHWGLGYHFEHPWKPRLGVQYNYASGDRHSGDGRNTTFLNFFPGNHALYGFMDTTGWMNLHNPQLNLSVQPTARLKLTFDYNLFWNATNNDAWYGANTSSTVRSVNARAKGASNFRGHELDFNAFCKLSDHVGLQLGYSLFLAGDYLAQTGASDNAHFGYAQLQFNF